MLAMPTKFFLKESALNAHFVSWNQYMSSGLYVFIIICKIGTGISQATGTENAF